MSLQNPDVEYVLRKLEYSVGDLFGGSEHTGKGFYTNMPWNYEMFRKGLAVAKSLLQHLHPGKTYFSFVDAGCGLGIKVDLAHQAGWKARGIEINETYCKIARGITYLNAIAHGDIRTHDYSKYDCVYFYQPMHRLDLMQEFFTQVHNTVTPNSLVFSAWPTPLDTFSAWQWPTKGACQIKCPGFHYVRCPPEALLGWQLPQEVH